MIDLVFLVIVSMFPFHVGEDIWTFYFVQPEECKVFEDRCYGIVNCDPLQREPPLELMVGCINNFERIVVVSISDLTYIDAFGQDPIEHELRHVYEPDWRHEDPFSLHT